MTLEYEPWSMGLNLVFSPSNRPHSGLPIPLFPRIPFLLRPDELAPLGPNLHILASCERWITASQPNRLSRKFPGKSLWDPHALPGYPCLYKTGYQGLTGSPQVLQLVVKVIRVKIKETDFSLENDFLFLDGLSTLLLLPVATP
jgi:hypothetical protein